METLGNWILTASAWWDGLGYDTHYKAWLGFGIALMVVWVVLSYHIIRRLLGHRKINGAWINGADFEALLDRLCQKERDGASLALDDIKLLEKYRPDRHDRLNRLGGQEFVSW